MAKEQEDKKPRNKAKRRGKKGPKQAVGKSEDGCSECAALQSCSPSSSPRTPLCPRCLPLHGLLQPVTCCIGSWCHAIEPYWPSNLRHLHNDVNMSMHART